MRILSIEQLYRGESLTAENLQSRIASGVRRELPAVRGHSRVILYSDEPLEALAESADHWLHNQFGDPTQSGFIAVENGTNTCQFLLYEREQHWAQPISMP